LHHSPHGSQYTSIDYSQELTNHGALASVGYVGDAYDNALAELFVDRFKTELIADRVLAVEIAARGAGRAQGGCARDGVKPPAVDP
jgi:transposase InsO family protein